MLMKTNLKKTGRRLLSVVLCLILGISVLTVASATASAGLETEQPVLVITGQGLPDGARGSAENASNERAYTIDELQALGDLTVERLYSSVNRYSTKSFYRGQGVDLEGILALSGYTGKGRVGLVATDGYAATFNLEDDRYYYPNLADDDDSGAELVMPVLAWKNVSSEEDKLELPAPFATQKEAADDQSLRLLAGQLNVEDINSNLYSRNVNKVIVGDAIEDVDITVLGEEYTRADIMLMPRAEWTYEYTTQAGDRSDTVRGVPLEELLKEVSDSTVIKFQSVDGWGGISNFTMTKSDLVAKNAILAYEAKDGDDWSAYYRSFDDGSAGYFRLMVDGTNGAHAVNTISTYFDAADAPAYNQDEVFAALNAGILPDSVTKAGWKNDTSRLAAAEAMVLLIEKASGKTMDELAEENGWDLTTGGFDDTDSEAVTFLKYAEVSDGMGDNMYGPESVFTRAQAVTMIGRAAEAFFGAEMKGENPFTDVPAWAAPFVGYAADNGIALGVGGGLFNSNGNLQNQQTALFLIRALNVWE